MTASNFYPRPPRGGRPSFCSGSTISSRFLSTPSARRATTGGLCIVALVAISIHALREEGDALQQSLAGASFYFYPRPPRGGRRATISCCRGFITFLSTPSARRATVGVKRVQFFHAISIHALREEGDQPGHSRWRVRTISIHALREEGDAVQLTGAGGQVDFYPRPPRGGRQQKQRQNLYFQTNYTTFCTNLEEP